MMSTGIAIALLNVDIRVTLVEALEEALAKAEQTIRKTIARDVQKGRVDQARADARIAALSPAGTIDALADVDLVIEAVF